MFRKSSDYRVPKRALSSNDSNVLQKCSRKRSKQNKVAVSTNRYNFRPRGGKEVESRPTMERKKQQGGPVRSRKGRGRNDNPYIEERTRSSNRNSFLYSFEQVVGRIIAMKQVTVGCLKFKKPSNSGHYNKCVFLEEKNKFLSCNFFLNMEKTIVKMHLFTSMYDFAKM
ncbi:hypothetical protein TNCV_2072211 [Trichonephila clavipes]|nr:hypothetical protein TNCV_2072211 [Trichonephila clavipes]